METLHARSGVTNDLRYFAFKIREIAETQPLPEYGVQVKYRKGQRELITLYRDKAKPCRPPRGRRLKTIRGEHVEPAINTDAHLVDTTPMVIEPTEPPAPALPESRADFEITLPEGGQLLGITFPAGARLSLRATSHPGDAKAMLEKNLAPLKRE